MVGWLVWLLGKTFCRVEVVLGRMSDGNRKHSLACRSHMFLVSLGATNSLEEFDTVRSSFESRESLL